MAGPRSFQITLSGNEYKELSIAAGTRGMRPSDLFERLMLILINEKLIDAVMDDGDFVRNVVPVIPWDELRDSVE